MHLKPLESGVEPHHLQYLHTPPESVVIPWVFFCKDSLHTSFRTPPFQPGLAAGGSEV